MDEGLQFVARRLAGQPMAELCHVAVSDPVRSVSHAGVHPSGLALRHENIPPTSTADTPNRSFTAPVIALQWNFYRRNRCFSQELPVRLAIRLWEKMMEDRGSFFTSARLPIATAVLAPGIFIADTVTRVDIAVPVLYVAVVLFSPRFWRPSRVAMAAAGCAALILSYVITRNTGPAIEGMARAIGSPVFISSVPNV
jgi:membrane-associated phospholipid phosphatase